MFNIIYQTYMQSSAVRCQYTGSLGAETCCWCKVRAPTWRLPVVETSWSTTQLLTTTN